MITNESIPHSSHTPVACLCASLHPRSSPVPGTLLERPKNKLIGTPQRPTNQKTHLISPLNPFNQIQFTTQPGIKRKKKEKKKITVFRALR